MVSHPSREGVVECAQARQRSVEDMLIETEPCAEVLYKLRNFKWEPFTLGQEKWTVAVA